MAIYIFSYDLINERSGFDYQKLWKELKRLDAHKVQYSMWLVNVNDTAKGLCDHFKSFVDSDDRLWASSVRKNEHWYVKAMAGTNEWLKRNPPQ